jgi:hypothetical protein
MSNMDIDSEINKKEDYTNLENMVCDYSIENSDQLNLQNFSPLQVNL